MTPSEMSNEELADWLNSDEATTADWDEVLEIGKEIQRRLRTLTSLQAQMSGMIPRPKVDLSHSTEGSFLLVNGVSVVRIGWQTPSVCATLEKALGMEGGEGG